MFRRKLDFVITRYQGLDGYHKKRLRADFPEVFKYWYDTCVARIKSYGRLARFVQHPVRTREDMQFIYKSLSTKSESPLNSLGLKVVEMLIGWNGVKGARDDERYYDEDYAPKPTAWKKGFISRFIEQGKNRTHEKPRGSGKGAYEYDIAGEVKLH
jgi:hypothetical protein